MISPHLYLEFSSSPFGIAIPGLGISISDPTFKIISSGYNLFLMDPLKGCDPLPTKIVGGSMR